MRTITNLPAQNNRQDAASIIKALGGSLSSGMCRCPAHDDKTPSLSVSVGREQPVVVNCRAGCSQEAVIGALKARGLWPTSAKQPKQQEWESKQHTAQKEHERFRKWFAILRAAARDDIRPTDYLQGRGIDHVPECAMLLSAPDNARLTGKRFPAMVMPVVKGDRLVGAQVTHLSKDAKHNLKGMHTKKNLRNTYGQITGGHVQLAEIDPNGPLLVGEGIEDALSTMQITGGLPGIATLGTSNMKSLEAPQCSEIIIVGDNDNAGCEAAEALAQRLADEGRKVRVALPANDGEDWNDVLRKNENKVEELRERILSGKQYKESEVRPLGMEEFRALQFPPRAFMLKPWLTTTGLCMIDALPGHGKTWLALSVGYAVASGRPLLDWAVERCGHVLYVDGELPGEVLQARLGQLGPALPPSDFQVLSHSQFELHQKMMPDLGEWAGREFLDQFIEENEIDLIILDSVSTLVRSGVDNDIESWRAIQAWSLKHRARGRAVIYLHHHGRSGNPRGTSSREIVLDTRIKMVRDPDTSSDEETVFKLEFPKAREFWGKDAAAMLAYLSTQSGQVEWRREFVKDHTRERIRELRKQGVKQKAMAKELGLTEARISQIVKELHEDEMAKKKLHKEEIPVDET